LRRSLMQYNHNKDQVQVVVTLEDGISETHVGADTAHVDSNTRALYVMAGANIVTVYAHGYWQSAVTAGRTTHSRPAYRLRGSRRWFRCVPLMRLMLSLSAGRNSPPTDTNRWTHSRLSAFMLVSTREAGSYDFPYV